MNNSDKTENPNITALHILNQIIKNTAEHDNTVATQTSTGTRVLRTPHSKLANKLPPEQPVS